MNSSSQPHPNRGRTHVTLFITVLSAVLLVSVGAMPAKADQGASTPIADTHASQSHLFRFVPANIDSVKQVNLAGDFNGWSTTATPMTRRDDAYEAGVKLEDGIHYYKFVVDGRWLNDPQGPSELQIDDGHGGKNSGVMIGLDAGNMPAPAADHINASAIAFDQTDIRDCNLVSTTALRISIRAMADDVSHASVLLQSSAGWNEVPLFRMSTQHGLDRFAALVTSDPAGAALHLVFKLSKPSASVYVADSRAFTDESAAKSQAYQVSMQPTFETPEWASHAVWYQIFPERFRNGDPSNDPANTQQWTSKWFDRHPGESGNFYGKDVWARRYGGDIQGIRQELPYLRSLGINAIYLNPIFQAEDLHKYDTSDYRHVDEHFGVKGDIEQLQGETEDPATWQWTASDKVFLDFLAEAHRQGFKVIIDGVFNHVGRKFWAFQDVLKNGKDSKYVSWFDITDWNPSDNAPFHYHAWDKDNGFLPALKKDPQLGIAHGPREHIIAITRRWLAPDGDPSRGVDGFRLDAPEGIAHPFWAEWRQLVKSIKPDAYITGEIWDWAQSYLQGDQYDAVMNYQFAIASQQFFVNQKKAITSQELNTKASQLIFNYPFQVALVNQNLFDSHDTDRVASMFVNPDLTYDAADRIQDNGPQYNPSKPDAEQRLRMLQEVAWQMTFVGAPMIYYGDEAGMWSPDDPSDRQPMIWKDLAPYDDPQVQFDQEKFDWYQRLIAIRRHLPALQAGFYRPVYLDDARGIYVFARDLKTQHVYVALNHRGRAQEVEFTPSEKSSSFVNWIDPASSALSTSADNDGGRTEISVSKQAKTIRLHDGKLSLQLQPWGTAVVTQVGE